MDSSAKPKPASLKSRYSFLSHRFQLILSRKERDLSLNGKIHRCSRKCAESGAGIRHVAQLACMITRRDNCTGIPVSENRLYGGWRHYDGARSERPNGFRSVRVAANVARCKAQRNRFVGSVTVIVRVDHDVPLIADALSKRVIRLPRMTRVTSRALRQRGCSRSRIHDG